MALTILDGSIGQELVKRSAQDPTGLWSTEVLIKTPDLILDVHADYFEAGADIAVSINISHGGLAYQGRFCPNEQVLRARWEEHPDEAWLVDERY